MPSDQQLRVREFFRFYGPLVLTSQMMTLAAPLINLHLSRAENAKVQLAAYAVGFGCIVFLNAPLLVAPNVTAALFKGPVSLARLTRITVAAGVAVLAFDVVLATTPLGDWVFTGLLDATPRVASEAKRVVLAQAAIPLLVGLRGLRFGLAMRGRATGLITLATLCRLVCLIGFLIVARRLGSTTAGVGALALTVGIGAETLFIGWATRRFPVRRLGVDENARDWVSFAQVSAFAWPLVASAFVWTALRPLINGILGRTVDSEAAQAAFGVIHPLILLTASALWALQATGQVLASSKERGSRFLALSIAVTVVCSGLVMLLTWNPTARDWLLTRAFTLSDELQVYIRPAMAWIFVTPIFLGLRAAFKGMIMATGSTRIISVSAVAYLAVTAALGMGVVRADPAVNGALLGTGLIIAVEAMESGILGAAALRRFGLIGTTGPKAGSVAPTRDPVEGEA